ncbi:MAG: transposase [Deltaproteobacteria bacterium]|nr:transposase [Deltaproteobacteria bacterium]
MPRAPRLDTPGLLQHVIVRGIEKRDIFLDDDDRRSFVERLSSLLQDTHTDCLAWALLSNHLHLLLRPRVDPLQRVMRRLLTGHAVTFNLRHGRTGHLFQNRYKSIACDEDAYLLELVRYIHLNPIRAGIVSSLDELDRFPWSGHSVLMRKGIFSGQQTEEVLRMFGKRIGEATKRYRAFVADGIAMGRREELVGGPAASSDHGESTQPSCRDSRVLGGDDFIEHLRANEELLRRIPRTFSLQEVVDAIAEKTAVTPDALISGSRSPRIVHARALVCHVGRAAGHSATDIARKLHVSVAAVCRGIERGNRFVEKEAGLREYVDEISSKYSSKSQ